MDFHAAIVRSDSLRAFLASHRAALLQECLTVFKAHQQVTVGGQNEYGLKHGALSLGLNGTLPALLRQILGAFAARLDGYDLYTPELFFGLGKPVRPHNDVSLFLRAGQEVPIQLWILLDSCVITSTGPIETTDRNLLEVCVPTAPGPVYVGSSFVLTPDGRQDLDCGQTVGGSALENGDMLLFRNGCVHFAKPSQQQGLFRAALAVRAIRKDRREDDNYVRWMKQLWASDEQLQQETQGTYASSARRMLFNTVDDQPPDRSRLTKIDANDYGALTAALERVDPEAVTAPVLPEFIDLRTAQSLMG